MKAKRKIIIIGAGPGGLSAGMLLAYRGFSVKILEKENIPGGRNGRLVLGDYKFDIGPTFFMMDGVLRRIFAATNRDLDDYAKLTRLSPMYRLHFADKHIDVYDEPEKMKAELKRVFPGEENGLDKFLSVEKKRLSALFPILGRHNNCLLDAFRPSFWRAVPHFSIGRSLFGVMGDYFRSEHARLSFTFQSKYLGMSPWECPGAFGMVPYVEHADGIYHARGGLSAIAETMAKVVGECGGEIKYGVTVKQLIVQDKKVIGVERTDGKKEYADVVVANPDFSYLARELVQPGLLRKWSPKVLDRKRYSCSIFMWYVGIKRELSLPHHTIVFAHNYRQNVADIFGGRLTDKDFSFYVRNATAVDPTLAPTGKTALYVLVPVANTRADIDWSAVSARVRGQLVDLLADRLGVRDLESDIEVEKIIAPPDWEKDFNVAHGAVFNLAHNLGQMLWWRPHNQFEELQNLYLVGGGTHPGSGLPTIYESGRIVADLINKKFN